MRMGGEKINYNDNEHTFKRMFGVKIKTFNKMIEILEKEYSRMHKKGGSPPKMSVEDKLYATLKYLRESYDGTHRRRLRRQQKHRMRINSMGGKHLGAGRDI